MKSYKSEDHIDQLKKDLKESHQPVVVAYGSSPQNDIEISTALALREKLEKISDLIIPKRKRIGSGVRSAER